MRERCCRRGVGVVVGGHVDGLHRRDGPATGRGDALLQLAHLVGKRRLVAHRGRHAAEQRGHLGTRLGEPEDVVDEQQHVLLLLVAEVLRHGQRRQRDPHTSARRLVHLTEHQRGVLEHIGLAELDPQVVALTGALAHAGENRGATEVAGDTVDHLLDEHGLADAGAAEQGDLAAAHVRGQQVDDLEARLEHLGAGLELVEGRRLAVDRPAVEVVSVVLLVQADAKGVEHVALDAVADRHRDCPPGVDHVDAADQAVGRLQCDAAHQAVAEVQGHLQRQRLGQLLVGDLGLQRVEQFGHRAAGEFNVDHRAGHPDHAAVGVLLRCLVGLFGGSSHLFFFLGANGWRRLARSRHRRSR